MYFLHRNKHHMTSLLIYPVLLKINSQNIQYYLRTPSKSQQPPGPNVPSGCPSAVFSQFWPRDLSCEKFIWQTQGTHQSPCDPTRSHEVVHSRCPHPRTPWHSGCGQGASGAPPVFKRHWRRPSARLVCRFIVWARLPGHLSL